LEIVEKRSGGGGEIGFAFPGNHGLDEQRRLEREGHQAGCGFGCQAQEGGRAPSACGYADQERHMVGFENNLRPEAFPLE